MNIIVISDIHGDLENIPTYLDKISKLKFDVIICPGDFTDVNVPKGFKQEDIARIFVEELKTLKKPFLAVPGNMDTKEIVEMFEKEKVSIHGKGKIIGDFGFYGFGGAKTPFETNIEPSEEEIKLGLEKGWKDVEKAKYKIQVTHNPPKNTRVDMLLNGVHVGSDVVKEFIETHNPIVAISAHIHEARGIDKLKNTFLLNSGRFPEGYFGLINIQNGLVNGKVISLIE